MPQLHLTDRNLKSALEKSEETVSARSSPLFLWDTSLKGFGVRINPGGQVSFIFKTRIGKKQVWHALGDAEKTTCKIARAAAEVLQGKVTEGVAPTPTKTKNMLWDELLDLFEKEHLPKLKRSTRASYQSVLDVHLRPAFHRKTVQEITDTNIKELHASMIQIPRQANVSLMILRLIFERAEGWRCRALGSNPVVLAKKAGLKPYPEGERDRQLSDDELQQLGKALEAMDSEGHRQFCDLVRLLLLSGARLREVMGLRWEQINEKARTIRWDDTKTGKVSKPLNDALFEVLARIPRLEDSPWVFQSTANKSSKSGHLEDIKRPWRRLLELAEIEDVHRHDLRHLHGNAASELGHNLQTIAALLGHRQTSTTERYSKVGKDPRLAASNEVSASLNRKLRGQK